MSKNKYIIFGRPAIGKPEIAEVVKTLRSGWIGTGPKVTQFESAISAYVGAKFGLALNSCTAALHLSLLACGVGRDDEVITSPLTFCATANAIMHTGATPVFADVERDTMNIDPVQIERKITKKTKAIIPVHMAGRPCNMDAIMAIAKKHNLYIIEDAAHALGAEYKGKRIGNIGDLSCFSFYVTKNIVTGEGGMITTNNQQFADKVKVYGLHGMSKDAWKRYSDGGYKHYDVIYPGFKYNMMDLQASIGIHQLKKIDAYDKRRREIWDQYTAAFASLPITIPLVEEIHTKHARHLYTVLIDEKKAGITRDRFMGELHSVGIGTGVHFLPVHLYAYYRNHLGYRGGDYPNAEYIGARTVSLPLSAALSTADVKRIINGVKRILSR